jgi:hypothetical protein
LPEFLALGPLGGESLDDILANWEADTPVPAEIRAQVRAELDRVGFPIVPE